MRTLSTAATLLMAVALSAQSTGDVLTWKKGANLADTKTYTTPVNSSLFSLNSSGNFALLAQSNFVSTATIGGYGFIVGPSSATDNNVPQWDGITGKLLKDGLGTSTGANDAADAGKLVKFRGTGGIFASTGSSGVAISGSSVGGVGVDARSTNSWALYAGSANAEAAWLVSSGTASTLKVNANGASLAIEAAQMAGGSDDIALFSSGNGSATITTDGGIEWTGTGAATTRTNLGLGTLATQSGTFSGTSSGTNTGDQTITNSSNSTTHTVTLSGSGGSVQLAEGSNITLTTTGTGSAGVVTIASTSAGVTDGDKGDITVSSSGATWTIDNEAVTRAKMENLNEGQFLARNGGFGSGPPEAIGAAEVLDILDLAVDPYVRTSDLPGGGAWGSITGTLADQTDLNTALGLKADIASPTFTGTPAAPTAAANTNTTQLATTAYVQAELSALGTVATARTGAALAFDVPAVYNSAASPSASSVTVDWTGAVTGTTVKAWFNHSSEPTWPAGITVAGPWHASNPNSCTFTYHGSNTASGECVSDQSGAYTNPQTTYFPNVANVPTDFATTGTTPVVIAGLSGIPVKAGKLYGLEMVLRGSCSSSGGSRFGFWLNTGTDHILRMAGRQDVTGDTYCNFTPTAGYNNVNASQTWWPNNATNNTAVLRGTIRGGAVDGVMELRGQSVTSGQTTTVYADGSFLIVTLLN